MDESRKRTASSSNAKNINSSLDEDFGNDFLTSWKLQNSGKGTIDFSVDSVPKSSKKFSFDNLDDFGLDGAFDKLSSFKMGMSDLDFSSPVKKKVKHNTSNGDDLSEGEKETEKDNFSFSFDFNELGKFNLDAKLGIEEKSMSRFSGKANPVSSEGNKDTQRGLSAKVTDILEDNNMKQTQTPDICTSRPSHLASHESLKNASLPTSNVNAADSSDKIQEHTNVNPERVEQTNMDSVSNGEHSKDACPTNAAVKIPFQNFSCSAVSGEDPTQVPVDPMSSKDAPIADFGKVYISSEGNGNEQSISSQSRDTSTVNPNISSRPVNRFDSRNEAVEESVSLNEGSRGNQCFSNTPVKFLKKTSRGTKNTEEGTSALKSLSSSMQRETRNVEPALINERGGCALSKTAIIKASRVELTSETALIQLSGASTMTKDMTTESTDLKREHKQVKAGPDKYKTALSKTYSMPALHGVLTTSMNVKGDRNAKAGLEPPSPRNSSLLNARNSTGHSTGQKNVASHLLRKTSNSSDSLQGTTSEDNKISTISQLTGVRIAKLGVKGLKSEMVMEKESAQLHVTKGSPVTSLKILNSVPKEKPALPSPSMMQKIPEEPLINQKAPMAPKRIMRSPAVRKSPQPVPELVTEAVLATGSPKAIITSVTPCEMGDISDLELPALLENDGNVEKAEACRKELEDICILLKRKHAQAKELAVRAIVNNNMMLMLNHPMFEEKICTLQKFTTDLRSKKYLFEEVGTMDDH